MFKTFKMPAGKYYVGDLCYVMHPQWDEFCQKTISGHNCIDGIVQFDNGVKVVQFGTAYGDGLYSDMEGLEYSVDAGLIGCIKVEDIKDPESWLDGGNIIQFEDDFECYDNSGVLCFGHVEIDTVGEDENEDDDED
jgi:hypothetical protein